MAQTLPVSSGALHYAKRSDFGASVPNLPPSQSVADAPSEDSFQSTVVLANLPEIFDWP